MRTLARLMIRHRVFVVGIWLILTLFGAFSAGKVADRFSQEFSVPGYSGYEANRATQVAFGVGRQPPVVLVFTDPRRDVTTVPGIAGAIAAGAAKNPGAFTSSYFSTGSKAYVSKDRRTTFAEIYPAGDATFEGPKTLPETRRAVQAATPKGVTANLTGRDAIELAAGSGGGPGILSEALIGGFLTLVVLFFVFGTLPAIAMPIAVAVASILTTFSAVWALTYVTSVSLIIQFLIALLGLGIAVDYALLMIFRFRDELAAGRAADEALEETVVHAGRAVAVSGSTVAIGLLAMILIPVPFIRSIAIAGALIPVISVIASLTLLPALLSIIGTRINSLRVLPKRFITTGHDAGGAWQRWAGFVMRRPVSVAVVGGLLTLLFVIPLFSLNAGDAQAKFKPGAGDAIAGRQALTDVGISAGVMKPITVLAKNVQDPATLDTVVAKLRATPGIVGADAPADWRRGETALVEAFTSDDASSSSARDTLGNVRDRVIPDLEARFKGVSLAVGGAAAEERDFIRAVYSSFPLLVGVVILLTYILLARAFRSLILPLKAVILNVLSLSAALGIMVFIFQSGNGSSTIWNVQATESIPGWIPIMVFAFLYGVSMDYEVFMLSRVREEYDRTGSTSTAVAQGLAGIGKLITSAALILMFVFLVLSFSPGSDVKAFGAALAAGVIVDATIIRVLLVPSLMQLMKGWNWWLPEKAARVLRVKPSLRRAEPT